MEFWLIKGNEKFQLPVNPGDISISYNTKNDVVDSLILGEVNLGGKTGLASISISSFFPAQRYRFLKYSNIKTPFESAKLIEKWNKDNSIVRFLVTETTINITCLIDSFTTKWQYGTKDVDFQLELKEYRSLDNKDNNYYTPATGKYSAAKQNSKYSRPSSKPQSNPVTYTVKTGDTLMKISKRVYGTTSKWNDIAKKNGIKNPNLIYPGQKLVI